MSAALFSASLMSVHVTKGRVYAFILRVTTEHVCVNINRHIYFIFLLLGILF